MKKTLNFIMGIAVLAMIISLFMVKLHYSEEDSGFCFTGGGCEVVDESDYSEIFGLPLSLYGFFTFLVIFILGWFIKKEKRFKIKGRVFGKKGLSLLLLIISIWSFLFALYLVGLELFVIHAFCSYCLILDVLVVLILIFSVKVYREVLRK